MTSLNLFEGTENLNRGQSNSISQENARPKLQKWDTIKNVCIIHIDIILNFEYFHQAYSDFSADFRMLFERVHCLSSTINNFYLINLLV